MVKKNGHLRLKQKAIVVTEAKAMTEFKKHYPNPSIKKFSADSHFYSNYQPTGQVIFKVRLPWACW